MVKVEKNQKIYYLFDCEKYVLGRMSTKIAMMLQGKNSPMYAPNRETEIFIVIVNSDKIRTTGKKEHSKKYHTFSGYPGGISTRNLETALALDSTKVIWNSLYGMLPKNKLRDKMMKRLLIFKDMNHGIENEKIEEIQK